MSISIRGIRINQLTISRSGEDGQLKVSGQYQLISTADRVLATQGFNNYNDSKVDTSPATKVALDAFVASLKSDINAILGLEGA